MSVEKFKACFGYIFIIYKNISEQATTKTKFRVDVDGPEQVCPTAMHTASSSSVTGPLQ